MATQQAFGIPGIRTTPGPLRLPKLEALLEGVRLEAYAPADKTTIAPAKCRWLVDGYHDGRMALAKQRLYDLQLKPVELPEGHLFRLVTNAELASWIAITSLCARMGFGSTESREIIRDGRLKEIAGALDYGEQALYAEMESETAQPATSFWGRMESALAARAACAQNFNPNNLKNVWRQLGLELTEIVLLGLAISPSALKKPIDANLAHNIRCLRKLDVSENFSFIVNEAVGTKDIMIVPESDLAALDELYVRRIKEEIRKRSG